MSEDLGQASSDGGAAPRVLLLGSLEKDRRRVGGLERNVLRVALNEILELLEPLPREDQSRVLAAARILLGLRRSELAEHR